MAFTGIVRCAKTGSPLAGIPMTDGKHIVKTGADGSYALPGWERVRMIYADVLTNAHDDWYQAIEPGKNSYDFALDLAVNEGAHGFMHMSDTEIGDMSEEDCAVWTAFAREKAKENGLAFIFHGGDICGDKGLPKHHRVMNSRNMECPVRYCIGNHDFRGEEFGESVYEEYYGPTWYSFDCGNVHYVVTAIRYGDRPCGYEPEDQWNWLYEDLKQKDPDKGLILFNHGCSMGRFMRERNQIMEFNFDKDGKEELLLEHGLMAVIFGHLHINYHGIVDGFHYLCTNSPKMGGIDSSPSSAHIVKIDEQKNLSSFMTYWDERKFRAPGDNLWSVKLPGEVLHSTPVVYENTLLVGLNDDGWPKNSGVVRVDAQGKQLWYFRTKNSVKNDVAVENGVVFAQDCDGNVYAIDLETGCEKWQTKVPLGVTFYNHCCVRVYEGKVFAGGTRQLSALDMETGEILWSSEAQGWGEPSANRPVFYKNLIIIGAVWRRLYALDINTGKEVWELQPTLSSFFYSTPLVAGDRLIVPAGNGIYVLNPSNGAVRREITGCGMYLMHAGSGAGDTEVKKKACFDTCACPVLDGDVLYIGTVNNGVLALNAATYETLRHYPVGKCLTYTSGYSKLDHGTVDGHILVEEETLRFAASDGYLYTYGKLNGLLIDRQWIGAPSFVSPVRFGGGIAVADLRGNLTVFPIQ